MLLAVTTSAPTNEQPARPVAGLSHRLPGLRPVFDEDHCQPCFPLGLAALSGGFDRHGPVSLQPVAFSAQTYRSGIFLPGQGGGGAGDPSERRRSDLSLAAVAGPGGPG